jgi:amino acid adenylation domain-containing protein
METTVSQAFRLSPTQKQLWLSQQGGPHLAARCAALLEGALDPPALEAALGDVVARHEILRTTFQQLPGMKTPVQTVGEGGFELTVSDRRGARAGDERALVEELLEEQSARPFDFERGPLLRASLVTLSESRHALLVTLPSLCADAWSLQNLLAETRRAYAARLGGEAPGDEPTQYVQFSEWHNELLEDEDEQEGREFWRQTNYEDLLALGLPFERPAASAYAPGFVSTAVGPELLTRVEAAAREHQTTAEVFLLACWHALLHTLSGKPDTLVGHTRHGRKYEELHEALGAFAAELPTRCRFGADSTFGDALRQATEEAQRAQRWQEYFTRPPAYSRGFPYAFEYAPRAAEGSSAGVRFRMALRRAPASAARLKLTCEPEADGRMLFEACYDSAACARAEAELVLRRYLTLVGRAAERPGAEVWRLCAPEEAERRQLLVEWNRTEAEYPPDECVHELFERQAALTPEAAAVVFEGERLSYAELNRRADRLAQQLRAAGVGPDARVAILMERSAEIVVALLGVLKAGGAYVPLDHTLPHERVSFMLADSDARVVLAHRGLLEGLDTHAAHVFYMGEGGDVGDESAADEAPANPGRAASALNLAYVIYTSGSTGRPKGVAVEHRQLLNYVRGVVSRMGAAEAASFALVSTFAADLGHTMIFPALCCGGTLHVISQERTANPDALAEYFELNQPDYLKIVPSHLEALLSAGRPSRLLPRRRLVLGGEASRREWVAQLRELAPACSIMNHYGPTETTVGVLTYEVGADDARRDERPRAEATLPLGRPLANTKTYVLDARMNPVPAWVAGELYVGGAGVARGYVKRPAHTAERFVPDPFSGEPGARLYRTGDRALYLPGGDIAFLGRTDSQVKVRGYRVELGEIESALAGRAGVRECVVVARDEEGGGNRLAAYVVPEGEGAAGRRALDVDALRDSLRAELPEYMIPADFVILDSLPLTPNGKVNARALPPPEEARTGGGAEFVAPRTALEELLAGIWAAVLKVERVGVLDNFFSLGGHSLLAMRVVSKVREMFKVELPLRVLFEATNVEELARAIIAAESKPGQIESIARVLKKIKGMSPEAVRETLEARKTGKGLNV